MIEADLGFSSSYEGIRAGPAPWFRQIADESARRHGLDPDFGTWE